MARVYIKYSPARRGLTGMEYLPGFLDEYFPTIDYTELINDGLNRFGFIEGSGDDLAKAFMAISQHFSIKQLTEDVFIGYCKLYYNEVEDPDGQIIDFTTYMSNYGITVSGELTVMKEAKKDIFREIVRKELRIDSENIADVLKTMLLFTFYYDDLTAEEKTTVDDITNSLLAVYDKNKCITAYNNFVTSISGVISYYYNQVDVLNNLNDPDEVKNFEYDR